MDQAAVEAAIKQALSDAVQTGGALTGPIEAIASKAAQDVLKTESSVGGSLEGVVQGALTSYDPTAAAQFSAALNKALLDFDPLTKVKGEYPFITHLASMDTARYKAAWKALLTDPDNTESLLDSFQDSAVANIMALAAAHPGVSEVQRLKAAAALRNAPKVSFKQLCLPSKGGGADKLQVYMAAKGDDPSHDVRALARSVAQLYLLIEKRYTSLQTIKKGGPTKAETQRQEMMEFVYHTIKAYKLRTTKPTAVATADHTYLYLVHAQDLHIAAAKILGKRTTLERQATLAPLSSLGGHSGSLSSWQAAGKGATQQQPYNPAFGNQKTGGAKGTVTKPTAAKASGTDTANVLLEELKAMVQANSADADGFRKFLDDKYKLCSSPDDRAAYNKFVREFCRNCLMAGRGIQKHGARKCREMKNDCVLPCTRCAVAGRGQQFHWLEDCPGDA